jgi:predicted  nucleic acid-binding Zn-ribbon protein
MDKLIRIMKYLAITLSVLFFASCKHAYEKESVIATFEGLEPEKVDKAFDEYEQLMTQIKKYYSPDSITHEISLTLDNFKALKKGAKSFKSDYNQLKENIYLEKEQLEKLKLDLTNKAVDETKVQEYLAHEQNHVDVLQQNLGTLVFNYDIVLTTQETLAPKVKSLIFNNGQ